MRVQVCVCVGALVSLCLFVCNRGVKWTAKTGFLPFGFSLLTLEAMLKPIN